jgi:hypothetical protein
MSYLIPPDYTRTIQDGNLSQVITANQANLVGAELQAVEEAKSHLRQKYDVSREFTDTTQWVKANTYYAADRVYLNAAAYDATATYAVGSYTLYTGVVYVATATSTAIAFNASHWSAIGPQYQLYYAIYPHPVFDLTGHYKVGDQVYWKGKSYTCAIPTSTLSHDTAIQYNQVQDLPYGNVFPDDAVNGARYWGSGTAYSVPANTLITNTTYWTQGDNRDADMVQKIADIALYHLHSRITPNNVPKVREVRYMGNQQDRVVRGDGKVLYPDYSAKGMLQAASRGDITLSFPLIQPKQGGRIRYGGAVRQINQY